MRKIILVALATAFAGACAFLFNTFYQEAQNTAIARLNEEQMIHAKQAARGIEEFFATWTRNLDSLAKMDEVIDTDPVGKRYMKLFYEANQEQVTSITRLDERGVIIHNFPQIGSVGTDISQQTHVRELLRDHQPVISDVFKAVEGFDAVALHVPVFRGSVFKGSVGILINFQSLANRYLDVIKIGRTGYAWVVSRDGTILYTPIPEFTGKSVFETIKDHPSLSLMVNAMLQGHEGAATYTYDRIGDRHVAQTRKYGVYMPVHVGSTFWSIAVASAEQDVLSGLISFRNKLAVVIGALFICGMVFSTLGAKAWLIVKEEEKRKQAERNLQASERSAEKFSTLFDAAPFAMALATTPDGVLYDVNQAWLDLAGFTRKDEVIGKTSVEMGLVSDGEARERLLTEFRQHDSVRSAETAFRTRAGVQRTLLVNLDKVDIGGRKFILSAMEDITERKQAEMVLQTTSERFYDVLSSMYSAVLLVTDEGRVEFANQAFCDRFGLQDAPADLVGLDSRAMIAKIKDGYLHPDEAVARIREVLERGQPVKGEELAMQGGRTCLRDFVPLKVQGKSYGRLWIHIDITERKRAEAALRESEVRYRSLFNTIDAGFCVIEMVFDAAGKPVDYRFLEVNAAFAKQTGLYDAEGKRMRELAPAHEAQWFEIYGKIALTGESQHFVNEAKALNRWYDVYAYRVGKPESRQVAILFNDITAHKQAETEILRRSEELRAANEELTRFNRITMGRELRIIELKKQVNELHARLGQPLRYAVEAEPQPSETTSAP